SASVSSASATSHSTAPVAGSCTGIVPEPDRHSPSMKSPVGTEAIAPASVVVRSRAASSVRSILRLLAVSPILEVLSTIRQQLSRPGGTHMATLSPLLRQATPVVVDHARGCEVFDTDGRRHLDFTAGIGVTSTGHCHPRVVAAAQEQVGRLIHGQYTTVMHQPMLDLVARLGDELPPGLASALFANSGSEAAETP